MPDGAAARYAFPPRLMRAAAAAYYLGMSETAFRTTVAPTVAEVRIGGIVGWLREDLDAWLDARAGRAAASPDGPNPWHEP
jgi:predicted DNA-binding transcriptional regulator AlpA